MRAGLPAASLGCLIPPLLPILSAAAVLSPAPALLHNQLAAINGQLAAINAEFGTSNSQLTRTNVDPDNFIYTVPHNLKAPILNIEGLLYLLQGELPAAVKQQ